MNLNEISIWVGKVFDGLYIGWPYKTALGIVFLALERHLELFTAFACIVCVDFICQVYCAVLRLSVRVYGGEAVPYRFCQGHPGGASCRRHQ